ncbi:methylated-DNA--[protein]-cysteine S-methyltransferase [Corynebacterium qintianiae]|uniref:Methylated-DNA--protein-cysteine methyltransferase n=1 Tax=Corynebacterium qintianiae TaxID=2709392 RepID=A0A7T0KMH3_9CORY|nr:methylated-DNA--[protein]-cysteine S-methyltransferase [Corynebacterium qintianiae]QPK82930.1 methylated-DNA--[protein]-cysteine S-methyltransferase [Corynebacterium qintianiae]
MTLTWTTTDTPIGELLLAASPNGLVRVAFECEGFDTVRRDVEHSTGERLVQGELAGVQAQLAEYFTGERTVFDLELDWCLSTGFRGRVQRALLGIVYGRTETYSQIAHRLGNPKAVRAVGTGCGTNPLPIVAPCHRVLRSDGSLGGYRGGLDIKRQLLDLEATRA